MILGSLSPVCQKRCPNKNEFFKDPSCMKYFVKNGSNG